MSDFGRMPPHNLDAEASVLGSILLDNEAYHSLEGTLRPEHFYKEANRKIFSAIENLISKGNPADSVTLIEELRTKDQLEEVGGVAYLVGLSDGVPVSVHAKFYSDIVVEKANLRGLIAASSKIMQLAYDEADESKNIAARFAEDVTSIADNAVVDTTVSSAAALREVAEYMSQVQSGTRPPAYKTGFVDLDRLITGFSAGSLNILGARPSQGKTALALAIGEAFAARGERVLFFSLEMSRQDITLRRISSLARVEFNRLRSADRKPEDDYRAKIAMQKLAEREFFIDDRSEMTIGDLRARAMKLHRQSPLNLVIVDYVQLIASEQKTRGDDNENRDLTKISRGLKALAKQLQRPVLVLSQLSRNVESRPNKRPMMSDLRGSGSLEQDADMAVFLYRDEYYNPSSEKAGTAEVLVRKNRNGAVGDVELQFSAQHTRFENLSKN